MTEDTEERILGILYSITSDYDGEIEGRREAAEIIAAEIEGKNKEIATLKTERDEALAVLAKRDMQLSGLRAEVEKLKLAADAWELQQEVYAAPDGAEKIAKLMAYGAARDAYNRARAEKKS